MQIELNHYNFLKKLTLVVLFICSQHLFAQNLGLKAGCIDLTRHFFGQKKSVPIRVHNQCDSENCWAHAMTTLLEDSSQFNLSTDFLFANHIINQAIKLLNEDEIPIDLSIDSMINEGGNFNIGTLLIREYGIVPQNVFRFRQPIHESTVRSEFYGKWITIINEFHEKKSKIKNSRYKKKLIEELRSEYLKMIFEVSEEYIGKIPEEFEFQNTIHSPKSFLSSLIDSERLTPTIVSHGNEKYVFENDQVKYAIVNSNFEQKTIDQLEKNILLTFPDIYSLIIEQINQNKNLFFTFYLPKKYRTTFDPTMPYFDYQTGRIASNGVIDFEDDNLHAVVITDYALDIHGQVYKIKILNSWGENVGNNGEFWMDKDFFEGYFHYIGLLD